MNSTTSPLHLSMERLARAKNNLLLAVDRASSAASSPAVTSDAAVVVDASVPNRSSDSRRSFADFYSDSRNDYRHDASPFRGGRPFVSNPEEEARRAREALRRVKEEQDLALAVLNKRRADDKIRKSRVADFIAKLDSARLEERKQMETKERRTNVNAAPQRPRTADSTIRRRRSNLPKHDLAMPPRRRGETPKSSSLTIEKCPLLDDIISPSVNNNDDSIMITVAATLPKAADDADAADDEEDCPVRVAVSLLSLTRDASEGGDHVRGHVDEVSESTTTDGCLPVTGHGVSDVKPVPPSTLPTGSTAGNMLGLRLIETGGMPPMEIIPSGTSPLCIPSDDRHRVNATSSQSQDSASDGATEVPPPSETLSSMGDERRDSPLSDDTLATSKAKIENASANECLVVEPPKQPPAESDSSVDDVRRRVNRRAVVKSGSDVNTPTTPLSPHPTTMTAEDQNSAAVGLVMVNTVAPVANPQSFFLSLGAFLELQIPPCTVEFAGLRLGSLQCKISVPDGYGSLCASLAALKTLCQGGGHVLGDVTVTGIIHRVVKVKTDKAEDLRKSRSHV